MKRIKTSFSYKVAKFFEKSYDQRKTWMRFYLLGFSKPFFFRHSLIFSEARLRVTPILPIGFPNFSEISP